jgi:glycerophosphoryl diester phosphodiesterase
MRSSLSALSLSVLASVAASVGGCATGSANDSAGSDGTGATSGVGGGATGGGGDASSAVTGGGGVGGSSTDVGGGTAGAGGDVSNGCPADECAIDGSCVEPGTPSASDPCEVCVRSENAHGYWHDATSPACDDKPYWTGVTRPLAQTPYGRKTAISCHNCYVTSGSSAESLTNTLAKLHAAQASGADLLELDVKDQGGVTYVEHEDSGSTNGALLATVLADSALKSGNQLLFVEMKEKTEDEYFVRHVLEALKANGYATAGRPVVLRAFDDVSHNLAIARRLLATADFVALRPYVRLHVLIDTQAASVEKVKAAGYHGVEFQYQAANLFGAVDRATSLDLGTNAWTIPVTNGEVFVSTLRDEVDAITCEYPVAKARSLVATKNGLLYVNASAQPIGPTATWFADDATPHSFPVGGASAPKLEDAGMGPLFGSALVFEAGAQRRLATYDADNDVSAGYLVSAVVQFAETTPSLAGTAVIAGKADSGGFSLELFTPAGGPTVLRFGVFVDGAYQYATYPASKLTTTRSYVVTGAYDGDGQVWIWVDDDATDSTKAGPVTGGVTQDDSLLLVGADPQGAGAPRFFFSGKLRSLLVQKWANH